MDSSNTSVGQDASAFDPQNVNLTNADPVSIVCYLQAASNNYNGHLGARISAVFVILVVSTAVTFFPVLATQTKMRIPLYVYLFARYFGAGVIVATAFIHLLDPAYAEIGANTCVGMTGGWSQYSWPPAIALASCMGVFLLDFGAERYVEKKYDLVHDGSGSHDNAAESAMHNRSLDPAVTRYPAAHRSSAETKTRGHQHLHSGEQDGTIEPKMGRFQSTDYKANEARELESNHSVDAEKEQFVNRSFQQQIAAFLILEFGVIFHSVIIGLTLGTAGKEFAVLYPVIVFHQSFEGLGLGARLSAIPFPKSVAWMPWVLCAGYGVTTPIALAVGLGLRTTYISGSFTANVVSGILNSTSAGILLFTGLVELLARDFLFNPDRTNDDKQLAFMVISVMLGAGIMALLGKWA